MTDESCEGCRDFEQSVYQHIRYTHCKRGFRRHPFGCKLKRLAENQGGEKDEK
jgi:hypothetical protein